MNNILKNKGFTLIELLVVVSIIGLLASVVMTSLNTARAKARDTKRMQDLHQIKVALEMYFDVNGRYPAITGWAYSNATSWDTLQTALAPYIPSLPKDPKNNRSGPWTTGNYSYAYGYNTASFPGKYDLVTQFEDVNNNNRCELKLWRYHTNGNEALWCGSYSKYLYADH